MFKANFEIRQDPGQLIRQFFQGRQYSKIGVLADNNTKLHCYPKIQEALPPHELFQVEAGEEHKNMRTCEQVWDALTRHQFDRHALLLILGGGVLGDLGGFCAATYKRGIDFVLLPTTLLAQVDASVGGKLGIDFQNFKNHVGLFAEPVTTLISPAFLETLPERELRSGYAEVIKHCLISDPKMWKEISAKPLNEQNWPALIRHSVEFKAGIIQQDPKEGGIRKILNFGHTIGHACESYFLSSGNRIFHGEAIAAGMIIESHLSLQKRMINEAQLTEITVYIQRIFGLLKDLPSWQDLKEIVLQDKKNKGQVILMALLQGGIGSAMWDVKVTEEEVETALSYYRSLH